MATISSTAAPNIPLSPRDYNPNQQEQISNALRLYFNQVDNFTRLVSGPLGMQYLDAPHISAFDTASQYAPANDTPTLVQWNTSAYVNGFTLNLDNTATVGVSGVYLINYSLNLVNTDNAIHDAFTWLQVNGVQLANSSRQFTLQSRKSAGVYNYVSAHAAVMFSALAGESIGLYWATDAAFMPAVQEGIFMEAEAAQTTPYVRPATPSASGSIAFLGRA